MMDEDEGLYSDSNIDHEGYDYEGYDPNTGAYVGEKGREQMKGSGRTMKV